MKAAFILLVVGLSVIPDDSHGWRRRRIRWGRVLKGIDKAVKIYRHVRPYFRGKRDFEIAQLDTNKDGFIDQSEMEQLMDKRDVEQFMGDINDNGDTKISLAEFEESMNTLSKLTERELEEHFQEPEAVE